ncbi:rod shape-determining protein MreD [Deltaproteobacteria bacterium]|nr:rod shape-determining protein MreD [Deltaproteobacteria bacterium]
MVCLLSWSISILFILIKGDLMNHIVLKSIDVDIVIVLIVYLFIFYGETGAGIYAFGQGLIIDVFSGGMHGLFTLLYLIAFSIIKLVSRPLDLLSTGGQIAAIFMTVLLKKILMIILLYLFSLEITLTAADFLSFIFSAICSGLIAPFLFCFLNFLNRLFIGADGEA